MQNIQDGIVIKGARQNNLKNLSLTLPTGKLIVITGVSGSGKSTLAFDTIYAEGQRRYVETFSAYARQFLDRMDKPAVDSILGIPPAIAIDQSNPVRTSRSTVGTMTELNDYLKLAFARLALLHCPQCARIVRKDTPQSIVADLHERLQQEQRINICLPIRVPHNFSEEEIVQLLGQQGYTRIQSRHRTDKGDVVEAVQDRLRLNEANRERLGEALEVAMHHGNGRVVVYPISEGESASDKDTALPPLRFSSHHHCADCDIEFAEPQPSLFSFNSPIGACDECRGFGRIIGVDFGLVIPDVNKSLAQGAVRPWQTPSFKECQDDMMRFARKRKIPTDTPWSQLSTEHQQWVLEGEGSSEDGLWYGVRRFFNWLETKAYKMHIRVLLSKYRAYTECHVCHGTRLKAESLWWRLHGADRHLNINEVMTLSLEHCADFFAALAGGRIDSGDGGNIHSRARLAPTGSAGSALDEATQLLMTEVRSRLGYLLDVGLGYLTLDRQSRTLSGGEVQRINLTTALGTSLVNTLFVLDEPSIGLHSRDMTRMIRILHRLRDAGNTLIVVEHDPQVMLAADLIIDIGPGPGKDGGEIRFMGTPAQLLKHKDSLTAQYLNGKRSVLDLVLQQKSEREDQNRTAGVADTAATYSLAKPASARATSGTSPARDFQSAPAVSIQGASEHNLRDMDIRIPLGQLVCLTGVSGSGKSTLIHDVLYRAACKYFGQATEAPGAHTAVTGLEHVQNVVMVDQSPIGKTTRSIPATYVGAFDVIRQRFISEPLAKERAYTVGTFSFNAGNGRCPTCSGNGFEHVEMQFLSDVYLRCPECNGKRYRREILEVRISGATPGRKTIADVLEMTVSEALAFFADDAGVIECLQPLLDVGLQYVQLGQAVPTLSGGEAQRLKLAGHLATIAQEQSKAAGKRKRSTGKPAKGLLFLFDEPTTGLHFHDISVLMSAFRKLINAGHSLLIIEHNLDVIRVADWLIDIGPEGGDKGGTLVAEGTPSEFLQHGKGLTAQALREYEQSMMDTRRRSLAALPTIDKAAKLPAPVRAIQIHHAREHNLKNIDVSIPWNKFTVITGVSGSGKSTLAFDIVFGEGQRRYLESLNAYARQFVQPATRPDVDAIHGIPPTVAIEQRTSRGGRKSTVATLTEIYHFLRLLFVKLGVQHCPRCDVPIAPQTRDMILSRILSSWKGKEVNLLAPMVVGRKGIYKELAAWAASRGYTQLRADGHYLPSDPWPVLDRYKEHDVEILTGSCMVNARNEAMLTALIDQTLELGNGLLIVAPVKAAAGERKADMLFSTQRACPSCGDSFDELDPRLFSYNSKHGWCGTCFGTGEIIGSFTEEQTGEEEVWLETSETDNEDDLPPDRVCCPACDGQRLNPVALAVQLEGRSIAEFTELSVIDAEQRIGKFRFDRKEQAIARDVLPELRSRLSFLNKVGLGYLSLDRAAPTLSGGEAQRIRLASQLGSNLQGVCYILDEPTIGLHARDNALLIQTLRELQQHGNTVIVVEHDDATMAEADHLIDVGPGAGSRGGGIVAQGTLAQLKKNKVSLTGRFLANPLRHPLPNLRDVIARTIWPDTILRIEEATLNNLRDVSLDIPLRRLVAVSGVSGSGKSTLIRGVLFDNLRQALRARNNRRKIPAWTGCDKLTGWESVDRLLQVDQTPIGKTPRSCPASYIGIWDTIRKLFADTVDARLRGYGPGRFSFNVSGGRCETCAGNGMRRIEMNFLPDVRVNCEECHGWRFNDDTLAVRYKDKHIGHVLAMNVDEAVEFFAPVPLVHHPLSLLQDVGLGYLTLGQQSPTLSGGEAQRIKLVAELAKAKPSVQLRRNTVTHSLYILDEPTVGLHMADVEKLLRVLHRLVDTGNSVIVIEHNLDVIAEADWVIDMGPEGGKDGGKVIAQCEPLALTRKKKSHTGTHLARLFL
ncbi:MAG: excinuclease ABC subunit A [Gammaproteobacteria bacterium]|nr:excinuclease ABC subunit A [Gammaproteobacteria bacterium]